MAKLTKVNDIKILPLPKSKNKTIVRSSIFQQPFTSTFLAAKRGSGKTTALYHILEDHIKHFPLQERPAEAKRTSTIKVGGGDNNSEKGPEKFRNLTVFLFSSTLYSDENFKAIIDLLKTSKVSFATSLSTYDSEIPTINLIDRLIKYIQAKDMSRCEESFNDVGSVSERELSSDNIRADSARQKIDELLSPIDGPGNFLIVIDDLPGEIRQNPKIKNLLKISRNLSCINVVLCSQSPLDCDPNSLQNMDNMIVFGKMPQDRLEHIHNYCGLQLPLNKFIEIYDHATKEDHGFLYCDTRNGKFYKGFNEMYNI